MDKLIGEKLIGYKSNYTIKETLLDAGEVSNGLLYKVIDSNNDLLAVKILKSNDANKSERFNDEYLFQQKSTCPFIVKSLDFGNHMFSKNKINSFYVMNIYNCNYRHIISHDDPYYVDNPFKKIKYILDLCKAIKYMHNRNVIHRDLKPENILFDKKKDKVLISDFGIAHFKKGNKTSKDDKMANFDYHAPEQKKNGSKKYGKYTDIYALGLIINETFTSVIPSGSNYKRVSSVFPVFSFLDPIISTMIIQDYEKRESNILIVIEKIEKGLQETIKYKSILLYKIKLELEQHNIKVTKKCKNQIISDFFLTRNIFEKNINNEISEYYTQIKDINYNYHCNVRYDVNKNIYNAFITYKIFTIIQKKFVYESRSNSQDDPLFNSQDKVKYINEIKNYFEKYSSHLNFDNFKYIGMKMYLSLEDYHAREVLTTIDREIELSKDNILDSPILWIFFYLQENGFINKYFEYYPDNNVFELVNINPLYFANEIEMDNFIVVNFDDYKMESFIKLLKPKFPSVMKIDNEFLSFNLSDGNKFLKAYDDYFIDNGDAACGDIIDFIDSFEKKHYSYIFRLESYQIDAIIKFMKSNYLI